MKKYFIIIIGIIAFQNIQGTSYKEIMNELETSAWKYQNNFNLDSFNNWNRTFDKAKKFVFDNSKNFWGKQDKDIIDAINILEEAHDGLAFLVSRDVQVKRENLNEFKKRLDEVQEKINSGIYKAASSNKKEVKDVVIAVGIALQRFTQLISRGIQKHERDNSY